MDTHKRHKHIQTHKHAHNKEKNNSPNIIKIGTYVVLAILIVTFVGAPIISSRFQQQGIQNLLFGKYGTHDITYETDNYFGRLVQNNISQFVNPNQSEASTNSLFTRYAWDNAFKSTILYYALLDVADTMKYAPSPEGVKTDIANYEEFKDENGNFDRERYDQLSDQTKQLIIEDETNIKTVRKISKDIEAVSYVSSAEYAFYTSLNNNKRAFSYVRFQKDEAPNPAILLQYGSEHQELFWSIEYKSITVATKKEAETVYQQILDDEISFEEAVISYSLDSAKDNQGERGVSYAYQIENYNNKETLDTLKSLKRDEISTPVETSVGNFAIYSIMSEIIKPNFNTFPKEEEEELSSTVETYLKAYDPGIIEDEVSKLAEEFIDNANNTSFESSARTHDIAVAHAPLSPLNINNQSLFDSMQEDEDQAINSLSSEDDILTTLYSLSLNEISQPLIINSYMYVFQITDIETTDVSDTTKEDTIREEDKKRVDSFLVSEHSSLLREVVVDKNKLVDNFSTVFDSLYSEQ